MKHIVLLGANGHRAREIIPRLLEQDDGMLTSRASLGRFVADLVKHPERHRQENLGISQPRTDSDRPAAYR